MTIHSGKRGPYRWLETAERSLAGLLRACWPVLDGKYVVVTAFDSGPLLPGEGERAAGWWTEREFAFSPRLTPATAPPTFGFDEWLVFAEPVTGREIGPVEPFVNHSLFTLAAPDVGAPDAAAEYVRALQERFWAWLERLRPDAYVADGLRLFYATSSSEDYATVHAWLRSPTPGGT